jgi:hypothetical protein
MNSVRNLTFASHTTSNSEFSLQIIIKPLKWNEPYTGWFLLFQKLLADIPYSNYCVKNVWDFFSLQSQWTLEASMMWRPEVCRCLPTFRRLYHILLQNWNVNQAASRLLLLTCSTLRPWRCRSADIDYTSQRNFPEDNSSNSCLS